MGQLNRVRQEQGDAQVGHAREKRLEPPALSRAASEPEETERQEELAVEVVFPLGESVQAVAQIAPRQQLMLREVDEHQAVHHSRDVPGALLFICDPGQRFLEGLAAVIEIPIEVLPSPAGEHRPSGTRMCLCSRHTDFHACATSQATHIVARGAARSGNGGGFPRRSQRSPEVLTKPGATMNRRHLLAGTAGAGPLAARVAAAQRR